MTLSKLFSVVATQQIYLRENRTRDLYIFGDTAADIVQRNTISEPSIDSKYGRTALPLPFSSHLTYRSFREMEGTGIIPLGIATEVQHVDGTSLEPARFFEHDDSHFFIRMGNPYEALTLGILPGHAPLDMGLYQGIDLALAFSKALDEQIDTLSTMREKILVEAIIFYILHEERETHGILDFNAMHIKRRACSILNQSRRAETPSGFNSYFSLVRRLSSPADLGQAFRTKPTSKEVSTALTWLAAML